MGLITTFLMAVGLAMDAFAVSITNGSRASRLKFRDAFKLAFIFGLFQALMPLLGWAVGIGFKGIISSADHWIAFGLLGLVGGRMIYSDISGKEDDGPKQSAQRGLGTLLVMAIATSIDALVVGFSLTFVGSILLPVLLIGLVTFCLCYAGVRLGHKYSHLGGGKVQTVGGVILIAIGIKILIEHLS